MLTPFLFGIILFWLGVLSYFLIKTRKHYYSLVSRTRKQKIDEILDKIIENDEKNRLEIDKLRKEIEKIVKNAKFHFQKIGLIRFNPFARTGGEQSFVISLLDANDSGLIINFIYTHEGLRVYTKKVKEGKGEEYNLSEEENEAIKKAINY